MEIVKAHRVEGARAARGYVVVIDVLRAFTTAAFVFAAGARRILLVATPEEAFALRERDPELVLVGEVRARPIPGFDFGNSPEAIEATDLTGKTVVLRSSNGVQGVVNATQADGILLGSLSVVAATVAWLRDAAPEQVTLCAMGSSSGKDGAEDDACLDLLAARLAGDDISDDRIEARVRASGGGKAAMDPAVSWLTPGDLDRAVQIDRFPFAMVVEQEGSDLVVVARPAHDRRPPAPDLRGNPTPAP